MTIAVFFAYFSPFTSNHFCSKSMWTPISTCFYLFFLSFLVMPPWFHQIFMINLYIQWTLSVCPFLVSKRRCFRAQSQLHKEMVWKNFTGLHRAWLQPHPKPSGWTGTPTVSQTLPPTPGLDLTDAAVVEWEQVPAAGSASGGKTETKRESGGC